MVDINYFNNEEKVLINGICKNENISSLKRNDVEVSLLFSASVTDESDTMMMNLISGAVIKIQNMSDADWDEMKMFVPFHVVATEEDDVSEVPDDEDVI